MSFSLQVNSKNAINYSSGSNKELQYAYDFNMKPTHPYGTNAYKMTTSFISNSTNSTNATNTNVNTFPLTIEGLGSADSYENYNTKPSNKTVAKLQLSRPKHYSYQNTNMLNPLVVNPNLIFLYRFFTTNYDMGFLKNEATNVYDLGVDNGMTIDNANGTIAFPYATNDNRGLTLNKSTTLNANFSVGGFVKIDQLGVGSQYIFFTSVNNTSVYRFHIFVSTAGVLNIANYSATSIGTTKTFQTLSINTLYHIVVVINGVDWTVYLNGVPSTSVGAGAFVPNIERNTTYIGLRGITKALCLNGTMSNFFLYNDVLTQAQITEIYGKGYAVPPLTYYYTIPTQAFSYTVYSGYNQRWINDYKNSKPMIIQNLNNTNKFTIRLENQEILLPPFNNNLLNYYLFNTKDLVNNRVLNYSNNKNDLLITNGTINGSFTGTTLNSTIENTNYSFSGDYSIGCWFNTADTTPTFQTLCCLCFSATSLARSISIELTGIGGIGYVNVRDSGSTSNNGLQNQIQVINANTQYHVVFTNTSGTTWRVYINGALVSTLTGKLPNASARTFNSIGRSLNNNPLNFNGTLDGFFIMSKVISDAEVLTIYNQGNNATTSSTMNDLNFGLQNTEYVANLLFEPIC
jgi:hypothetical protein